MHSEIRHWSEMFEGEPSEIALRNHFNSEHYRVSKTSLLPKGLAIAGSQRRGLCFVLQGQCEHTFEDETYQLKAGQFAELPHGRYQLRIPGDEDTLLVMVYQLPRPGTPEWDRAVEGNE